MIITVTGHRPKSLGGFGQSGFLQKRLTDLAKAALKKFQPRGVITGMALGWDQAVAEACVALDIPWVAAVPFEGQERTWPEEAQQKYHDLLSKATKVVVVSKGSYSPHKFQLRNEWMVDRADRLLALWNGSDSGTGHTVRYAQGQGIKVTNLWASWLKHMAPPAEEPYDPWSDQPEIKQTAPKAARKRSPKHARQHAQARAREIVAESTARQAAILKQLSW